MGASIDLPNQRHLDRLMALIRDQGLPVDREQAQGMLDHLALVLEKNQVMNLTRIASIDDALVLHILDSLLFLPALEGVEGPILDIGTGAGYPGVPLALALDNPMVLMDSVGKKARAVGEFAEALGIADRVAVTNERAEAFAVDHREAFGAVVARAVAPLGVLVEYAQPLLRPQGRLVVSKGRISPEELIQGEETARMVSMIMVRRDSLELDRKSVV